MRNPRQHYSVFLWQALPGFTLLLMLVIMLMLPGGNPRLLAVIPPLPLLAAFFWLWEAATLRDLSALAALGLFMDVATGLPLGFNTSAWLLAALSCWYGIRLADDDKSFIMRWSVAGISLTVAIICQCALAWLLGVGGAPLLALLVQWLVSLLAYPLVHLSLHALRQKIYRKVWVYLPADLRLGTARS